MRLDGVFPAPFLTFAATARTDLYLHYGQRPELPLSNPAGRSSTAGGAPRPHAKRQAGGEAIGRVEGHAEEWSTNDHRSIGRSSLTGFFSMYAIRSRTRRE